MSPVFEDSNDEVPKEEENQLHNIENQRYKPKKIGIT